jgi:hypothetical protein
MRVSAQGPMGDALFNSDNQPSSREHKNADTSDGCIECTGKVPPHRADIFVKKINCHLQSALDFSGSAVYHRSLTSRENNDGRQKDFHC